MAANEYLKSILYQHNKRYTAERQKIYDLILKEEEPFTASDILCAYEGDISESSIYRNLQIFLKAGIIEKVPTVYNYIQYKLK